MRGRGFHVELLTDDVFAVEWRGATSRTPLVVNLVERGERRRDDYKVELARIVAGANDAQRRAFWASVRTTLADEWADPDIYGDLRAEVERILQDLVPEPDPEPLGPAGDAFVAWRARTDDATHELVHLLFHAQDAESGPPLLGVARWLADAPPAVGAWLTALREAERSLANAEPSHPSKWWAWPDQPGAYLQADLVNGVGAGYLSEADARAVAALNAERRAQYAADLERFPAEHAAWLRKRTALLAEHTRKAPSEVRAWLEANPPPEDLP